MGKKIKLEKIYTCNCGHEFKVKSILTAKMNYCYECGTEINKEEINLLLSEYKEEVKELKRK